MKIFKAIAQLNNRTARIVTTAVDYQLGQIRFYCRLARDSRGGGSPRVAAAQLLRARQCAGEIRRIKQSLPRP